MYPDRRRSTGQQPVDCMIREGVVFQWPDGNKD
jgi:hypothetical protein